MAEEGQGRRGFGVFFRVDCGALLLPADHVLCCALCCAVCCGVSSHPVDAAAHHLGRNEPRGPHAAAAGVPRGGHAGHTQVNELHLGGE
jgi:hypothetical protein